MKLHWYDGESTVLKIWGKWSILSLLLFPDPHCPGVVVAVRVTSIGPMDLFKNYLYSVEKIDIITLNNFIRKCYFKLLFTKDYYTWLKLYNIEHKWFLLNWNNYFLPYKFVSKLVVFDRNTWSFKCTKIS